MGTPYQQQNSAHKAPLNLPVHFHHLSTAISTKYELYPLDLNVSNHQQRISWLQHAPDFSKKKIKSNRTTTEYLDLTEVGWFWKLEELGSQRGILRDIERDAGIPENFEQLTNWIRNKSYKNTALQNLKVVNNINVNSHEIDQNLHT